MSFDKKKLQNLPNKRGVYIMKDSLNRVLYVGKAKNLKTRVKQYFLGKDTRAQISFLTNQVEDIEIIVVNTDKESLILENNLIKKYLPKYNILLKDDKTYLSIEITTSHKWPMIKLVRLKNTPKDKNYYFGPYTNAHAARSVKDLLLKLFPLRQCSDAELISRKRPCILYEIKKCLAPCTNLCTKVQYDDLVNKTILFLDGKDKTILKDLKEGMKTASDNLEYEKANDYLKLIKQINHIIEQQLVDIHTTQNIDVLGYFKADNHFMIVKLIFKNGKLNFSEHFSFSKILSNDQDTLETFILQNYLSKKNLPKTILVPIELDHRKNIEELFLETDKSIKIIFPKKGKNLELVKLANKNAKSLFEKEKNLKSLLEKQLLELQECLSLTNFPKVIDCFDTSNLSGTNPVASKISYVFGEKDSSRTRLFKIKGEKTQDVPAMKEVMFRYFSKLSQKEFPDLLVLDGAKAQLNAALEVFDELKIASIDVISIAKENALHTKGLTKEKVYVPHQKDPIIIEPTSPTLFLLQKIRDEAHRSAITFHKKRREKSIIRSELIDIPNIGEKKLNLLLKEFKSIKNLSLAGYEDLKKIKELSKKDIETILSYLKKNH